MKSRKCSSLSLLQNSSIASQQFYVLPSLFIERIVCVDGNQLRLPIPRSFRCRFLCTQLYTYMMSFIFRLYKTHECENVSPCIEMIHLLQRTFTVVYRNPQEERFLPGANKYSLRNIHLNKHILQMNILSSVSMQPFFISYLFVFFFMSSLVHLFDNIYVQNRCASESVSLSPMSLLSS